MGNMFDDLYTLLDTLLHVMFFSLPILIPLGVWKLVDIIIWLCHHPLRHPWS
jgi:hypothetical protein